MMSQPSLPGDSGHPTHPKYRPDIDGLRAIAVLSVVVFHAFPFRLTGGFIGVDIFFVISGFLISTIIFSSLEKDRYSVLDFYTRRVKRIFPALALVLLASYAFGWSALLADEFAQLGKHVAAGTGFVSNIVLWGESGYFDESAEAKPMLHLWSLGIEEQFYIFWPLILWFSWKRRLNLLTVTGALAAVSFAFNIRDIRTDAVATFYSPQTRFWELAIGSLLAYVRLYRQDLLAWIGDRSANVLAWAGMAMIAAALVLIDRDSAFPGWWALLPTLGAVLLIAAGMRAWPNRRLLASRPFVWFGIISYPLYLWHWPLLSFATIVEGEVPHAPVRAAAMVAAVALAWLTYRFVERPLRFGSGKAIPLGLAVTMAAIGCLGYFTFAQGGLAFRAAANPQIARDGDVGYGVFHEYPYDTFPPCTPLEIRTQAPVWDGVVRCLQSRPGEVRTVAIVGDSHAEHLFVGFAEQMPGVNVVYYIQNSLPVLSNPEFAAIFKATMADANIRTVIISAYWTRRILELAPGATLEDELSKTVAALAAAGKTVYLSDDVASFSFSPKKCKYESNWIRSHRCSEDRGFFDRRYREFGPALAAVAARTGARILPTAAVFCTADSCAMDRKSELFYRDDNHLNINGSRYLARALLAAHPELSDPK